MSASLLLDNGYQPLSIIGGRRAVTMVLCGDVDVLETREGRSWRSQYLTIADPAVIRLRHGVAAPRRSRVPLNSRSILERDGYRCAYCTRRAATIDHVVPRSKGGRHAWDNVVAACGQCNQVKADRFLADLGWELGVTPRQPSGAHWLLIGLQSRMDPAWAPWLPNGS